VLDHFDRILTPAQVQQLPSILRALVDKYAYVEANGDSVFCWDLGRYMNHSCEPASRGVGESFEVAIRDVAPCDELTCEYGALNLLEPLDCRCGAPRCRGVIGVDDAARLYQRWDEETRSAFALAPKVHQPLLPFAKVRTTDLPLLEAVRTGATVQIPSAREYALRDRGAL